MSNIGGDKDGTDGATRLPVGPSPSWRFLRGVGAWERGDGAMVCNDTLGKRPWWAADSLGNFQRAPNGRIIKFKSADAAMRSFDKSVPFGTKAEGRPAGPSDPNSNPKINGGEAV